MDFIDLSAQQEKIRPKIQSRVKKVLEHGKYIMGPEVHELETELSRYVGMNHCITCSSGTDALLMPLMMLDIKPGDAVLTTPFTYIATAEVIALLGATPIFVDIYPSTFNIDPDKIDDAINYAKYNNLKPRAIIPVDLFGLPARYRIIKEKAKKYNLVIIEDAAQGFGGRINNNKACSFGEIASTSFFPAKPLGCYGDGGAIFTNNEEFVPILKSIRVHGGGQDKYDNIRTGLNGRLDTIQAAILLEKLKIFENEFYLRNKVADYYINNISKKFISPFVPKNYQSSWAQFTLLADNEEIRNMTINFLKEKNIPSMIYYRIPLHLQKVYSNLNYHEGDFPISEDVAKRVFSIPMHPYLTNNQQDLVLEALEQFKY